MTDVCDCSFFHSTSLRIKCYTQCCAGTLKQVKTEDFIQAVLDNQWGSMSGGGTCPFLVDQTPDMLLPSGPFVVISFSKWSNT